MKIVKNAIIKIVHLRELHIGDFILYSDTKQKVSQIDYQNRTVTIESPYNPEFKKTLRPFNVYYKILQCLEENQKILCQGCGDTIEDISGSGIDFCTPRCRDKFLEVIDMGYK